MSDLTIDAIEGIYPQKSDYAIGVVTYGPDKQGNTYHVDAETRTEISSDEVFSRDFNRFAEQRNIDLYRLAEGRMGR